MEKLNRMSAKVAPWVALSMGAYHLLYTQIVVQSVEGHLITHLGFALIIILLSLMNKSRSKGDWYFKLSLIVFSLGSTVYLLISLDEIMLYRSAIPILTDLTLGVIVLIIVIIVNYMVFGKAFPVLTIIGIAYLFFGRYLPSPFTVPDVSVVKLLQWITLEFEGGMGAYNSILQLSAVYLFLFIFFGGLLSALGGMRFIIALGRWVGSKVSSGAAMVALVGSSLLGTVTGSTVANITITGSFTIPMMKKSGYTPEQAAAIEAVSSNGGQIMPPVMGATAFILAGFTGIPYIKVVISAIIPALIYYFCVFCYVQLMSKRLDIKSSIEPVDKRHLILDAPLFVIPIGILVFMLTEGFSLPFVGFWSIMSLLGLFLLSTIRKDTPFNYKEVIKEIQKSIEVGSQIAIICSLIGVLATCIKVSGLGIKFPLLIQDISGGHLLIALFITMLSSILLGMGVPTAAAYILVAVGAVPALIEMGVPLLSAHLFCFIFASFSHITPPVAIGALIATRLAEGEFWRTNLEAVKAAFVAFLLPYFIIYAPIVIMKPDTALLSSFTVILSIVIMVVAFQMFLSQYCFALIRGYVDRTVFLVSVLFLATYVFNRNPIFFVVGIALFIINIICQYVKTRRIQIVNQV